MLLPIVYVCVSVMMLSSMAICLCVFGKDKCCKVDPQVFIGKNLIL